MSHMSEKWLQRPSSIELFIFFRKNTFSTSQKKCEKKFSCRHIFIVYSIKFHEHIYSYVMYTKKTNTHIKIGFFFVVFGSDICLFCVACK